MSTSLNHTCTKTGDIGEIDCTSCQLSQLCHTKHTPHAAPSSSPNNSAPSSSPNNSAPSSSPKGGDARRAEGASVEASVGPSSDYSISTELTSNGNDYSIFYLVLAAAGVLAAVLFFYRFLLL